MKSGMTSWNVSPMNQQPQSMDTSLIQGLKMHEDPDKYSGGLIKLVPMRQGTTPSPERVEYDSKQTRSERGGYALNLEPITSGSP